MHDYQSTLTRFVADRSTQIREEPLYQTLQDLDPDGLKESGRLEQLTDAASLTGLDTTGFTGYDYVRLADDAIFILHGDRQPFGQLCGIPVYLPDSRGEREFEGIPYTKTMDAGRQRLPGDFYVEDPIEPDAYRFPVEMVEDHIQPVEDTPAAIEDLGDGKDAAYQAVTEIVEETGAETALLGSHLLGIQHEDSDLDIAVVSDDNVMDAVYEQLKELPAIEMTVEERTYSVERSVEKKAGYGTRTVREQYDIIKEVSGLQYNDVEIDLISMQEPGNQTGYALPSPDDRPQEVEGLEAEVVDASHSHGLPALYEIDTGDGRLDLVSFKHVFKDVLEEGDAIEIYGGLYEDDETVYLSSDDHYVKPSGSFVAGLLGQETPTDLTMEKQ